MAPLDHIYILHGWAYSTEKWGPFLDQLKEKGVATTMLKIPGLTDGTNPVWTIEDYTTWLYETLKHEKGPVTLLGHSNGGRISLSFTLNHPQMVKRLILVDSAGIYHNEPLLRLKRRTFKTLAALGKRLSAAAALRRVLHKAARVHDYEQATPEMRQTMANLLSVDFTPRLSEISVPTLIIWGARDSQTPVSDAYLLHKNIPHSHLLVLEEARHSPHFTHTRQVVERIVEELS